MSRTAVNECASLQDLPLGTIQSQVFYDPPKNLGISVESQSVGAPSQGNATFDLHITPSDKNCRLSGVLVGHPPCNRRMNSFNLGNSFEVLLQTVLRVLERPSALQA